MSEPNWTFPEPPQPDITPDTAWLIGLRADTYLVMATGSGHEVWLYDAAYLEAIRNSDVFEDISSENTAFADLLASGMLACYGLEDDYGADLSLSIGAPYTEVELSRSRWLEPQTTWLHLPSGRLLIESTEGSRILPDGMGEELTGKDDDGLVELPAGDYKLTLYRIDQEALSHEGLNWEGPSEAIVLTPGGNQSNAADHILEFCPRRDLNWVGKYSIEGCVMQGLIWFDDPWDTFRLNIDEAAWKKLGLKTGSLLKVTLSEPELELMTVMATSWTHALKLVPPESFKGPERATGSQDLGSQNGNPVETVFNIRSRTQTGIAEKYQQIWLPAKIEVIPTEPWREQRSPVIMTSSKRVYHHAQLQQTDFFDEPSQRLALSINCLLTDSNANFLCLAEGLQLLDQGLSKLGFAVLGDTTYHSPRLSEGEVGWRLYVGKEPILATLRIRQEEARFYFISGFADQHWLVTGSYPLDKKPQIEMHASFNPLVELLAQHQSSLAQRTASASARLLPSNLRAGIQILEEFLSQWDR